MKGGAGGGVAPGKRRWRGLVLGVLVLVVLSMLVPLAFLLGFHSPAGFVAVQPSSASNGIKNYDRFLTKTGPNQSQSEKDRASHIDDLVKRLGPTLPKEINRNISVQATNATINADREIPVPPSVVVHPTPTKNPTRERSTANGFGTKAENREETGRLCEWKYGSYCLWRENNREEMKDSILKRLKDQLFVARAYYPSIAKMPSQGKLTQELKQNIQDFERILGESSRDADLPPQIEAKIQKMETVISKAKSYPVDCNNVDKKLRQIYDMTEDEANFHMKQSAFLYQLAVQTMPKSLHCLSMRLTVEYFKASSPDVEHSEVEEKISDPSLQHYVIISKNVLATSVVINSTVLHAEESKNLVFHVLTDRENYLSMKLWFFRNTFKAAAVHVLNIEEVEMDLHDKAALPQPSLPIEFRVSILHGYNSATIHNTTLYMSVFSHSHFLLPNIFQNLKKVVILDDDIVVQQDLSPLWSVNMEGKVNGAMQFCSLKLSQLRIHTGRNSLNRESCSWMSGLNIIDLAKWRELDLTETFWSLVREMSIEGRPVEGAVLYASLLTFQDLIYPLDDGWAVSGLGYDYGLDIQSIKKAAVLHYNGKMKPWLELGIPKYKVYWKKYLNREDHILSECNVNP